MSEITLDTALKLIPIYGDDRNSDLQAYIDGVNFVLSNVKSTEQDSYLQIAKIRLRGEIGAAVRRSEIDTWGSLKNFLRDRSDKQQSDSLLEDQLISIKQKHGESIRQFADRIDKIGHKLIIALCKSGFDSKMAEFSTERRMHKSFTKGVVEPYKNILLNRKTNSFNEAVRDALSLEIQIEEDRTLDKRKPINPDKCFKCGKTGHRAVHCRTNRDVKTINNDSVQCYNCGKFGHIARHCRSPPTRKNAYNNKPAENNNQGNDYRLPSNSRHGGSDVTKPRDYKITSTTKPM